MLDRDAFRFVDIRTRSISPEIDTVFPGWKAGDERVVVLSPHDDDAMIGAGHAILAAQAFGGEVHVVIYCDGCLGYSTVEEKDTIVATRRGEAIAAYGDVGIPESHIHRFWIPDLAVMPLVTWNMPDGTPGACDFTLALLRKLATTRLVIPNGYREHIDHEAVFKIGLFDGPHVGDPIVAEQGLADPVRNTLQYPIWGDFDPEEAMTQGRDPAIRADSMILARRETAELLNKAIALWKSQAKIIKSLVDARQARRWGEYMMETYIRFDPRPSLDYGPYGRFLDSAFGNAE